jgi:hypothetical protein
VKREKTWCPKTAMKNSLTARLPKALENFSSTAMELARNESLAIHHGLPAAISRTKGKPVPPGETQTLLRAGTREDFVFVERFR